uniref:Uncharacterized protein n=1 Tax=Timema monikensis TaxID=170555 RepID=A0A7R9DXL6_9NEOP|nr:unnamed protein product [Timema monikensis]
MPENCVRTDIDKGKVVSRCCNLGIKVISLQFKDIHHGNHLNAAVTRPMSGDHTSEHNFIAAGISNLCNLPTNKEYMFSY